MSTINLLLTTKFIGKSVKFPNLQVVAEREMVSLSLATLAKIKGVKSRELSPADSRLTNWGSWINKVNYL